MASEDQATLSPEQLLEEGKKFLAAGNADEAVGSFQEACGILAEQYGQLACELAEPYYLYGRSLLELARTQNTVLGSGIPVPNERNDSSDEEGESPDEDGAVTNGDTGGPSEDHSATSTTNDDAPGSSTASEDVPGSSTVNDNAPDSSTTNENCPGSSTANDDAPSSSATNEGGPDSSTVNQLEEEESDLKLAWEILELARVICQKQSTEEYKLKLADVHLALAEVSLESDQTDQAIADLNSSLQIRELLLDLHDRRVAEVHFNLGLTYSLCKQPDQAIKHFNSSKDVLLKKKELLDKELSQEGISEERRRGIEEEVSEIDSLIPDLESKIADTREMRKMLEEQSDQQQELGFPPTGDKKPVSDISHLVRKRAPESCEDGNPAKRVCPDETTVTSEQ